MTNNNGDEFVEDRLGDTSWDYVPITTEAKRLVFGDRGRAYGHPREDFADIAGLWSSYKEVEFTPQDVAIMMILLKVARQKFKPSRDTVVDIAGYAECLQRIEEALDAQEGESAAKGGLLTVGVTGKTEYGHGR